MKNSNGKVYKEIVELLNHFPEEDLKKIPKEIINVFMENMDNQYEYIVDKTKRLNEQEMLPETKEILALIYEDYWATDDERKQLMKKSYENERKYQEEINKKYVSDNLFKNKKDTLKTTEKIVKEEVNVVKYNESLFKKIWNKMLNIFKR